MTRTEYYQLQKKLAREQRQLFELTSPVVTLTDLRRAYKHHGISITLWPPKNMSGTKAKKLRGSYHHIEGEPTVLISRNLPKEQRIFTMAHELKHHISDFKLVQSGASACTITEDNDYIEKGAEIFAAEFIYPENDFTSHLADSGIELGQCTAEDIVKLKRQTGTTLSYTSLGKRADILGYAPKGSLEKVRWIKLEESMFGEPVYKRIIRYRQSVGATR